MTDQPVVQLAANGGKTDADKANAYRAEVTPLLEQVAAIILKARSDGLTISFSVNADMRNQTVLINKAL